MSGGKIAEISHSLRTSTFRPYSPDIRNVIQETLRTLANIDFEHQLDFEKLERSNAGPELKQHIARKLRERHQQRREPYLRLVAELQAQVAFDPETLRTGALARDSA